MFKLFKNNHNSFIPKDIKNGMHSANFCTVKLGEKIEIDNNLICFVSYKDKIYLELNSGSYVFNKEFLLEIYTKQLKKKKKLKSLNLDLYYVNLNAFSYEFDFSNNLYLTSGKTKTLCSIKTKLKVSDPKLFNKTIINEITGSTAQTSEKFVLEFIEFEIKHYFLRKTLPSTTLSAQQLEALKIKLTTSLNKIGVELMEFDIVINKIANSKNKNTITEPKTSLQYKTINDSEKEAKAIEIEQNLEKTIDQTKSIDYTKENNVCPICKIKLIKGSIFCHKCGYNINIRR